MQARVGRKLWGLPGCVHTSTKGPGAQQGVRKHLLRCTVGLCAGGACGRPEAAAGGRPALASWLHCE